jgi:hypothetical protein
MRDLCHCTSFTVVLCILSWTHSEQLCAQDNVHCSGNTGCSFAGHIHACVCTYLHNWVPGCCNECHCSAVHIVLGAQRTRVCPGQCALLYDVTCCSFAGHILACMMHLLAYMCTYLHTWVPLCCYQCHCSAVHMFLGAQGTLVCT